MFEEDFDEDFDVKVTQTEEEEEKRRELLLANVREVMKTSSGKIFIWHIMGECGIVDEMMAEGSETYYNLGKRSVGLEILGLLDEADPKIYPHLLLENIDKEEARHVENSE